MLVNLNYNGKSNELFPVMQKPVTTVESTDNEEVVIYDECGDTLWDRVLRQEDKIRNSEQDESGKAG